MPVVATDCSGVQEMIIDKGSAFVISSDSVRDIVSTTTYILFRRDDLGNIVKRARKIFVDKHSVQVVIPLLQATVA